MMKTNAQGATTKMLSELLDLNTEIVELAKIAEGAAADRRIAAKVKTLGESFDRLANSSMKAIAQYRGVIVDPNATTGDVLKALNMAVADTPRSQPAAVKPATTAGAGLMPRSMPRSRKPNLLAIGNRR